MRLRLHRRLGVKLIVLFVVLAGTLALVLFGGMQRALSYGWGTYARPMVQDYVNRLAAEVGSPPDVAKARGLESRLPIVVRISGPQIRYGGAAPPHERHRDDGDWHVQRTTADGHRISFELALAPWHQRPRPIGWIVLVVLLVLIALAYHAVRRLFRPIDEIRAGALRFGQGDFGTPIPVRRRDELGELAAQVNTMASELRSMLDAKRELLLAISHELRSPLTRARLNAELVPEGRERDALLQDLGEMRELIMQLLEHERLAAGHRALHREPLDVAVFVRNLIAEQFADEPITLDLADDLGQACLDPVRLTLALRNLLHNALTHGAAAQGPSLRVRRAGDRLVFTVRDHGPGVSPEQLSRLSEPFYRPDEARTRDQGGVGLGLTLARRVAEAHGGSLALRPGNPGLLAEISVVAGP